MLYRVELTTSGRQRRKAERILRGYGRENAPGVWEVSMKPIEMQRLKQMIDVLVSEIEYPSWFDSGE